MLNTPLFFIMLCSLVGLGVVVAGVLGYYRDHGRLAPPAAPNEIKLALQQSGYPLVEKGGARIGPSYWRGMNATWPFITLQANPEEIRILVGWALKMIWGMNILTLGKQDIKRILLYQTATSSGLQFEHRIPRYPPFIVFWSWDAQRLAYQLQMLGYTVEWQERPREA